MRHTIYATFPNASEAAGAIAELEHADEARNHCSERDYLEHLPTGSGTKPPPVLEFSEAVVHRGLPSGGELTTHETAWRRGVVTGLVAGGVGGGLVTAIVVWAMLPGAVLGAALLGMLLGAAYGAFMGGISAANGPDPTLEKLAGGLHDGQVLVTVDAPGFAEESEVEHIVERHGGNPEHRHMA